MGNAQIHIEGIPFSFNKIVKQLKQDMKDDWFPDPLNHEDSLNPAVIISKFIDYDKRTEKKYSGHEAYQYNIPKQGFALRYALETSLWDRLIYQGIAGYLINFCDRHLNTNVFSHRWSRKPEGRYLFNHQIDAWKKFQNSVKVNLTQTTPWLLVTDVQNYFENIRIEDVKSSLNLLMSQSKLAPAENKIAKRAVNLICGTGPNGYPGWQWAGPNYPQRASRRPDIRSMRRDTAPLKTSSLPHTSTFSFALVIAV